MVQNTFDVLILGAGISGIGAACHLTRKLKHKRYAILERRQAIGGTWDLFRYPGIRSDSDMTTFGYGFKPWRAPQVLADAPAILEYLRETAEAFDVLPKIRFGRSVTRAAWCSQENRWTVTAHNAETEQDEMYHAQHLVIATGYYDHDQGYAPKFPGSDRFEGTIVHPQHWPENLQTAGKKVVVIGSGATAMTLIPALAKEGAKVTMLQRTPTYVVSVPAIDPMWKSLSRWLPPEAVYPLARARNIALQRSVYLACRTFPKAMRRLFHRATERQLRTSNVDVEHFSPHYDPWDQRLCVVPNGDLFKAIRAGKANVVTDTIDTFDPKGIRLRSGKHIEADIIITATGLNLRLLGGAELVVDETAVQMKDRLVYKGMMIEGVPNAFFILGYTNASWTLKVDIVCEHYCRIIEAMEKKGQNVVTPHPGKTQRTDRTVMDSLDSGYVNRGADVLPRQGDKAPWRVLNDYWRDALNLRFGRVRHRDLEFSRSA